MDRHNEILMDHIIKDMAATTSKESRSDPEIKKHTRKNDCYAYVAKTIRDHRENEIVQGGKVVVYSLGEHLGHCVLVDKNNNIIADNFKEDRLNYNKDNGDISYRESSSGTSEMGNSYKLDENSFSLPVKDYLMLSDNVKDLIEYKKNPNNTGRFVGMLNEGMDVENALNVIESVKPITQYKNKEVEEDNKLKSSLFKPF